MQACDTLAHKHTHRDTVREVGKQVTLLQTRVDMFW